MKKETLRELFKSDLEYLYDAEKELIDALPMMSDAAATPELRNIFLEHLERSSRQLGRLEEIFGNLGMDPSGRKSRGIGGLIAEGKELVEKGEELPAGVLDVSLIAAARRVGHYEIAAYGTLAAYAKLLGDQKSAELLDKTLNEEEEADREFIRLAVERANPGASAVGRG